MKSLTHGLLVTLVSSLVACGTNVVDFNGSPTGLLPDGGLPPGPPTVISTSPANNAINVSVNRRVTATFSKPMDPSTITTTTFTLAQGATPVPGTVTYAATEATATFTPTSPLAISTTYTAKITTGAKDTTGQGRRLPTRGRPS
jgi:hypothetical protein